MNTHHYDTIYAPSKKQLSDKVTEGTKEPSPDEGVTPYGIIFALLALFVVIAGGIFVYKKYGK